MRISLSIVATQVASNQQLCICPKLFLAGGGVKQEGVLRKVREAIIRTEQNAMSIVLNSKSGPDSKLHLEIPVSEPNAEFVVELVVRPKATPRELPPNYFSLLGSLKDETLIVHPQPAIELN